MASLTLERNFGQLRLLIQMALFKIRCFQKSTKVLIKGINKSHCIFRALQVCFPTEQFIFLDQTSSECNHCLKQSQKWCFSDTHVDHKLQIYFPTKQFIFLHQTSSECDKCLKQSQAFVLLRHSCWSCPQRFSHKTIYFFFIKHHLSE